MNPIERRIPRNLGGSSTLIDDAPFIGTVDWSDAIVAFGPAMFVMFTLNTILPPKYGGMNLLATFLVGLLGSSLLLVKPNHLTLSDWVGNYRAFKARPKHIHKKIATDGGLDQNGVPVSSNPDTRKITKVDKIYPNEGAVRRTDGTMVGAVKCHGINLDTATGQQWEAYSTQFANWFNQQVNYDVQLYMPMRQFDPTDQMQMYLDRKSDDDVRGNPILANYAEDRAAWMQTTAEQSFIREFYIFFSVSKYEIHSNEFSQGDLDSNLKKLPGGDSLGDVVRGIRGGEASSKLSESETIDRQLTELKRRRSEIMGGVSLGGKNKTTPVDGDRLGILLKEYWEGASIREGEAEDFIRKKPFVTGGEKTVAGDTQ